MIVLTGPFSCCPLPTKTVVSRWPNEVTATDDKQQARIGVLLLDDCEYAVEVDRVPPGASLSLAAELLHKATARPLDRF
jgi:hypothetical protein